MESIFQEVAKSLRKVIFWLSFTLFIVFFDFVGVRLQNDEIFYREQVKREVLFSNLTTKLDSLKKEFADTYPNNIHDYYGLEKTRKENGYLDELETKYVNLMDAIVEANDTLRKYLIETNKEKNIVTTIPFLDFHFSSSLLPLVIKCAVLYLLLLIYFKIKEIKGLFETSTDHSLKLQVHSQNKIYYPSLKFMLLKYLPFCICTLVVIMIFNSIDESHKYFIDAALDPVLYKSRIYYGIVNLLFLLLDIYLTILICLVVLNERFANKWPE